MDDLREDDRLCHSLASVIRHTMCSGGPTAMMSDNTLIRSLPCGDCGEQLLWTQNAWRANGSAGAAYVCRNGHVVNPALTRQCPACGVHDTEITVAGEG